MTSSEKFVIRLLLFCIIVTPIVIGIHYALLPQETKSIFVDSQGYNEKGRIYYSDSTSEATVDALQKLIDSATQRITKFWGEKLSDPDYIFLESQAEYAEYCATDAPAVTYLKLGSHIVLSKGALNTDIIAHELTHAELFERVGFIKWTFQIPAWFKHGLAMQNDYRAEYSEDSINTLAVETTDIDIKNFETDGSFYYGTAEEIQLHYMLAKKEVTAWDPGKNLAGFINALNEGSTFYEAYNPGMDTSKAVTEHVSDSLVSTEPSVRSAVTEPEPVPVPEKPVAVEREPEEEPVVEFETAVPEDIE